MHLHWHILPMYGKEYPNLRSNPESKLNAASIHEMTELLTY